MCRGRAGMVVCVTGASGFIASWIVKLLLERGYTIKATVRDLNNPSKIQNLLSLQGAKERLHLFEAELLEEGSFDTIIDGCDGVFHTASPVLYSTSNPQGELLDPAVKGTLNVLRSCAKVKSVRRVVLTSSMASVAFNPKLKPNVVADESWFSDPTHCEELKMWYPLAKTLAEDAAWEFARQHGIDMVVVNPGTAIGPLLQPSPPLSVGIALSLVNGTESYPNAVYKWVDVRDIAHAHILAFEMPSASGRYCLVGESAHCSQVINILRRLYPTLPLPHKCHDSIFSHNYTVSNEKAKSLGIKFIPLEESLKDTIESCKEKNLISF